jgi:AcrR family transcriptional regulator
MELYAEQGFDQTTAAQIAARAGVTERTFFRHFADKREVLFSGSAELKEAIVAAVAEAPPDDGPLDAVARGLDVAAQMLGQMRREAVRQRQSIIAANPELRERELSKMGEWAASVAEALRHRGVDELQASLAAEAGMTVVRVALTRWAGADAGPDLPAVMRQAVAQRRAVAGRP